MVCSCSDGGFLGHIHDSDIGEPSQQLSSLQANDVVALVESIHRTLQVTLASMPPSLRCTLECGLGALHSAVASTS
jgi:hypothetical protein